MALLLITSNTLLLFRFAVKLLFQFEDQKSSLKDQVV